MLRYAGAAVTYYASKASSTLAQAMHRPKDTPYVFCSGGFGVEVLRVVACVPKTITMLHWEEKRYAKRDNGRGWCDAFVSTAGKTNNRPEREAKTIKKKHSHFRIPPMGQNVDIFRC